MMCLDEYRYMQYVASLLASAGVSCAAIFLAWPSPTLPLLRSHQSPIGFKITSDEASWLVSISLLAPIPMTPITIILIEKFGRRKILLLSSIFGFVPWIMIIFAKSIWELYLARFIGGICIGLVTTGVTIYNSEIADNDIRGRLGSYFSLMKLIGSFMVLSVGPYVSYTVLASLCATIPVLFATSFYFMPETPYYLVKKGRRTEAIAALSQLASKSTTIGEIEKRVREMEDISELEVGNKFGPWKFLREKTLRKVIFITIGLKTLQQMSGALAIKAYLQTIIAESGSAISPAVSSIIFGAVQFPAALLSSIIVDKLGRKPLIITSALASAISLASEGLYFFLQDYMKFDVSYLNWLPTTGIVIYLIMSSMGVISLPYILVGELFPTKVRGIAVTMSACYSSILAFFVSKMFEPIKNAYGAYTIFWIYASCCVCGAVFVYCVLPETKGKTFAEIQEKLHRNRNNNNKLELATV